MAKAKWKGNDLWNLLNLPVSRLLVIYPQYTKGTLKGKRSYWRKQIREGKTAMPPRPEQEPTATWEAAAFDKEKGEWVHTELRSWRNDVPTQDLTEVFEPAQPAKITPTKRKRAQRIGRQLLVFGDSQIGYHRVYDEEGNDSLVPTHSEEALSVIAQLNAHERPDEIVNLSDTIDLGELSRFQPQSDSFHRTLSPSFQRVHDLYAQLRADNPDARITEVDSNHTARAQKRMMERYPEWYSFVLPGENYPMMSYYRLANLEPLGIDFISGYGAAEYVYGEEHGRPPIVFKHGVTTSSAPGATVRKEAGQNPFTHVVRGHGHSYERIAVTGRDGENRHYIQLGTTCQTTGQVPSYHSAMTDRGQPVHRQENWQQQAMMIHDYDGQYQFDVIDIIRGVAHYNGRTYDGRTE